MQYDNPAWWEEAPEYVETDFNGMSLSSGDSIQATVSQNGDGSWTTRLDDLTTGVSGLMTTGTAYGTILDSDPAVWLEEEGSTAGVTYAGGLSAEWIAEDYTDASTGTNVPFADFGTVAFTSLTTSLPSWGLTGNEESGVGDTNGYLYAAPSGPDSSGYGFTVTYTG